MLIYPFSSGERYYLYLPILFVIQIYLKKESRTMAEMQETLEALFPSNIHPLFLNCYGFW